MKTFLQRFAVLVAGVYVRLQTWFPFEMQVGINGREWLSRQMDRAQIPYQRSDNKFLWVQGWERVQQLFDQQLHCRVLEPRRKSGKPPRWVRALNPLAKGDADLLTAIADPKWMINDLKNRDLVAALYHTEMADVKIPG